VQKVTVNILARHTESNDDGTDSDGSYDNEYMCIECDEMCGSADALNAHMRIHTGIFISCINIYAFIGEHSYECIWCAEAFETLKKMEEHAFNEHVKGAIYNI
jgi:hypothetical protein